MIKTVSSLSELASKSNGVVTHHALRKSLVMFGEFPRNELLIIIQTKPGTDALVFPYYLESGYTEEELELFDKAPRTLKDIANDVDLRNVLWEFTRPAPKDGLNLYYRTTTPDKSGDTLSFGYWIHQYIKRRTRRDDVAPNVIVYAKHAWPELQLFTLDAAPQPQA